MSFYETCMWDDTHGLNIKKLKKILYVKCSCRKKYTQKGCGKLKFNLNLYHTTNRVMANRKNTLILERSWHGCSKYSPKRRKNPLIRKGSQQSKWSWITSQALQDGTCSHPLSHRATKRHWERQKYLCWTKQFQRGNPPAEEDCIAEALDYCPCCEERMDDSNGGICCASVLVVSFHLWESERARLWHPVWSILIWCL